MALMLLLACGWAWEAVREPRVSRSLMAALGVALAASAKISGGVIVVALVVGNLAFDARSGRRWRLLLMASVAGVLFFLVLNPYGLYYPTYTGEVQEAYARRASAAGMASAEIPARLVSLLAGPGVHGPWLGTLALAGMAGLLIGSWPSDRGAAARGRAAMVVSFPLAYTAAYAAATPYFKANNFLPVALFTSLAGAWAGVRMWTWMRERLPGGRAVLADILCLALLLPVVVLPGLLFVYRSITPSTYDLAERFIYGERARNFSRYHVEERWERPVFEWERKRVERKGPTVFVADELMSGPPVDVERADGLILRQRSDGETGGVIRRLAGIEGVTTAAISPTLFEARGPGIVVIRRHWDARGQTILQGGMRCQPSVKNCVRFAVEGHRGAVVSVAISTSGAVDSGCDGLELWNGARRIAVTEWEGRRGKFVSERFRLGDPYIDLRSLDAANFKRRKLKVRLHLWQAAGA